MISETRFANSHAGFWHALLPLSEAYLRARNQTLPMFARPLQSALDPMQRGVVNETAFQFYVASVKQKCSLSDLDSNIALEAARRALDHVRRMRQYSRVEASELDQIGMSEAKKLAMRIEGFFSQQWQCIVPSPRFPGCGWLDEAEGDVLADGVLFEIKAGDRNVRSIDLRQVLVYCALNFVSKSYNILKICILNPRTGCYLQDDLESLCRGCGGASAADTLGEIAEYMSEPLSRIETG